IGFLQAFENRKLPLSLSLKNSKSLKSGSGPGGRPPGAAMRSEGFWGKKREGMESHIEDTPVGGFAYFDKAIWLFPLRLEPETKNPLVVGTLLDGWTPFNENTMRSAVIELGPSLNVSYRIKNFRHIRNR